MRSSKSKQANVLIIEDEDAARNIMLGILLSYGFSVHAAENVRSALQQAEACPPDVLICDCNLDTKYDGIVLARGLQERFGCEVIVVSAYERSDFARSVTGLKVHDYMQKPIRLEALVRCLGGAIVCRGDCPYAEHGAA